jgi:hypothetical protein
LLYLRSFYVTCPRLCSIGGGFVLWGEFFCAGQIRYDENSVDDDVLMQFVAIILQYRSGC